MQCIITLCNFIPSSKMLLHYTILAVWTYGGVNWQNTCVMRLPIQQNTADIRQKCTSWIFKHHSSKDWVNNPTLKTVKNSKNNLWKLCYRRRNENINNTQQMPCNQDNKSRPENTCEMIEKTNSQANEHDWQYPLHSMRRVQRLFLPVIKIHTQQKTVDRKYMKLVSIAFGW